MIRLTKSGRWTRGGGGERESEKEENGCGALRGSPDKKRPTERARSRCENNFKMDLIEIGWEDMN
jgi:hypothetical protein